MMTMRNATTTLLLGTLMLAAAATAGAVTHVVDGAGGGDFLTIQAAVDAAASGDTLLIRAGVYTENVVAGPGHSSINLIGEGAATTIIDGGGVSSCLRMIDTSIPSSGLIADLGFVNGALGASGGYTNYGLIIHTLGGSWMIRDCAFRDQPGGGFLNLSNTATTIRCLFDNCTGQGGVFNSTFGDLTVFQCTFAGCGRGVSLHVGSTSTDVQNCIFFDGFYSIFNDQGAWLINDCNLHWEILLEDCLGCIGGANDLAVDPQFCGVEGSGNYYLQNDSPAAGDAQCGNFGAFVVGCEGTAAEAASWSAIKTLY